MLNLILDTARADERIRAVILSGSSANPNAPHDRFQDFDIVYIVTDVAPFWHNLDPLSGPFVTATTADSAGNTPPFSLPVPQRRPVYLPLVINLAEKFAWP